MVLIETYENSASFDITYLVFVWLAFIPTCINPILYGFWVLSPPMKERLRGYFRLSGRKCDKKPTADAEMSTTTTTNVPEARTPAETDSMQLSEKPPVAAASVNHRADAHAVAPSASSSLFNLLPTKGRHGKHPKTAFARSTEVRPPTADSVGRLSIAEGGRSDRNDHRVETVDTPTTPPTLAAHVARNRRDSTYSTDPLLNSCSDITVSTPIGSGSMLAAQQRLQQQQQQQRSAAAANHAMMNKRNNTLNSSLYSIAASSSSSSERKSLQTPPLMRLPNIVSDPDEAEYVASRCTSVSTYTNELEMDALERRRSLASPSFVDGRDGQLVGQMQQQHMYAAKGRGAGRQSLDSTERLHHAGQVATGKS